MLNPMHAMLDPGALLEAGRLDDFEMRALGFRFC